VLLVDSSDTDEGGRVNYYRDHTREIIYYVSRIVEQSLHFHDGVEREVIYIGEIYEFVKKKSKDTLSIIRNSLLKIFANVEKMSGAVITDKSVYSMMTNYGNIKNVLERIIGVCEDMRHIVRTAEELVATTYRKMSGRY
jgi:hypothetical protein